jgi:hypothetical protein
MDANATRMQQARPAAGGLRETMSNVAASVAVLTIEVDRRILGVTISSMISLSLDPPLVLFALAPARRLGLDRRPGLRASSRRRSRHRGWRRAALDTRHAGSAAALPALVPRRHGKHYGHCSPSPQLVRNAHRSRPSFGRGDGGSIAAVPLSAFYDRSSEDLGTRLGVRPYAGGIDSASLRICVLIGRIERRITNNQPEDPP